MFSRKPQYEASADGSSLDDLSRKLAVDLRKHVRKLDSHRAHSKEWLAMVDSLLHISNIAMMEHRLPREQDSATTLWEGEELTVRFLLEEGKLNLCLRLMHEYKAAQRALASADASGDGESSTAAVASRAGMDAKALGARCLVFEQSLSVLLKCAFEHVEPLQTIDMPELLEHAAEVLDAASACAVGSLELNRTQESAVPLYLASMVKQLDALDEARVTDLLKRHSIVPRVLHFCRVHAGSLDVDCVEGAGAFVCGVMGSEDWATHKAAHLPPKPCTPSALPSAPAPLPEIDARACLVELKGLLTKGGAVDSDMRKKYGPLLREADAIERASRLKADG